MGEQGPQGPVVCVLKDLTLYNQSVFYWTFVLILWIVVYIYFIHFLSLPQGYPGEKGATGSSDIIDFNGKLLDAFQVSDIKVSETRPVFITQS